MHSFTTLEDIVVVIAEDDDDIRSSLAAFLNQKGATVFACPDASEALQAVRAHHPNVVLSDIGLPNRDGFLYAPARHPSPWVTTQSLAHAFALTC